MKKVLHAIRDLEQSYRSVHLFFANIGESVFKNVTFLNACLDQLTNLDDPGYIEFAAGELRNHFDRLDKLHSYSLIVIPICDLIGLLINGRK